MLMYSAHSNLIQNVFAYGQPFKSAYLTQLCKSYKKAEKLVRNLLEFLQETKNLIKIHKTLGSNKK